MDRAQGARHAQGLCVLGQGASEGQGKEQVISVVQTILMSAGV
jgi:hypothetical protein